MSTGGAYFPRHTKPATRVTNQQRENQKAATEYVDRLIANKTRNTNEILEDLTVTFKGGKQPASQLEQSAHSLCLQALNGYFEDLWSMVLASIQERGASEKQAGTLVTAIKSEYSKRGIYGKYYDDMMPKMRTKIAPHFTRL
jgi:hypothetical protein